MKRGLFAVDLGFGNTFLRCKPTNPGYVGTRYVIVFNATSTSHPVSFTSWGHMCGICTELMIVYVARGLAHVGQDLDETERIVTEPVALDEAVRRVKDGRVRDAKSIAALLYYHLFGGK